MSVEPFPDGTPNVVASEPGRTKLSLDVATSIAKPAERTLHPVFRSDLKLVLIEDRDRARRDDWATPLVLAATIVLTFATTQFHAVGPVSADTWIAVYAIAGGFCVYRLIRLLWARYKSPPMTIDELVDKCIERKDD